MMNLKRKILILSAGVLIFISGTALFFIQKTQRMEKELQRAERTRIPREKAPEPKKELVPANPEDYGMIVISDDDRPKNQQEWDGLLRSRIAEAKAQTPEDVWVKLKEQIQEDPSKTEEKIKQIDEKIQKCNESLRQDPSNEEIKNELDRLMMLKSIAKELP